MAARTTSYRKSGRSSYSGSRTKSYRYGYQYGTAAPAFYPEEETRSGRRSAREQERIAKSRRQAKAANVHTVLVNAALVVSMLSVIALMCLALVNYISLQAAVTRSVQEIATYESELTSLKESNDETYNEILASINLDEIKERAITELGMSYAAEDQIISYQGDMNDYVHQVQEVAAR